MEPLIQYECGKCHQVKSAGSFRKNKATWNGLQGVCKDCKKKEYASKIADPEAHKNKMAAEKQKQKEEATATFLECCRCKKLKVRSDFRPRDDRARKANYACKECENIVCAEYRENNKDKVEAATAKWVKKHPEEVKNINNKSKKKVRDDARKFTDKLKDVPCLDCKNCFPSVCMHFDHLRDKEFNISQKIGKVSMEKLQAEIDKCEVVCANCHAIRTQKRRLEKLKNS